MYRCMVILKRKFNGTFIHKEHCTMAIYWYNKRWCATKHNMTKFAHYMLVTYCGRRLPSLNV